jgi:hypothetical protein
MKLDVTCAKSIMGDMQKMNITLDEISYNTILKLYIKTENFEEAQKVSKFIENINHKFNKSVYSR